jgi:hypothetical protein
MFIDHGLREGPRPAPPFLVYRSRTCSRHDTKNYLSTNEEVFIFLFPEFRNAACIFKKFCGNAKRLAGPGHVVVFVRRKAGLHAGPAA